MKKTSCLQIRLFAGCLLVANVPPLVLVTWWALGGGDEEISRCFIFSYLAATFSLMPFFFYLAARLRCANCGASLFVEMHENENYLKTDIFILKTVWNPRNSKCPRCGQLLCK